MRWDSADRAIALCPSSLVKLGMRKLGMRKDEEVQDKDRI
jgi:hypothetical protein